MALHGIFPSGGISSHRRGGTIVHPRLELWKLCLGLDTMVQTLQRLRLNAFPPIALLPEVLVRVRWDGVHLLLVTPFWPGRVWFLDLITLLNGSPWDIPVRGDLLSQTGGGGGDQLLVCYGPPKRGLLASHWIVDAICIAYESSDLLSPLGVNAHSTRSVTASKAFLAGVPMQEICNAAG